jgi:hypothetical protein
MKLAVCAAMFLSANVALACAPHFREGIPDADPDRWSEQENYERGVQELGSVPN